jgi:hypothetical protein
MAFMTTPTPFGKGIGDMTDRVSKFHRGIMSMGSLAAALLLASAASAAPTVIDFDDIVGTDIKLPSGYGGVHWGDAFLAYDQAAAPFTPHSGTGAAYFNYVDGGMTAGKYYTKSVTFDADILFQGAWFAGDADQVRFAFYRDGVLLGTGDWLFTDGTSKFLKGFDFAVDEIRLTGAAGRFVMDDFAYDIATGVPEPASWAMMLGGFGLAGGAIRRRRVTFACA